MARQVINLGTPPNGTDGDTIRTAMDKCNDNFQELYGNSSVNPAHISGFKISRPTATSLTVSAGSAYIPSIGKIVVLVSDKTSSSISVTANTWIHAYIFESSPDVYDVEWVTTAPSSAYYATARTKTGDNSRRYIGSIKSSTANNFYNISHNHATGLVIYLADTAVAPFLLVAGGAAVAPTTISASGVAPITAYSILLTSLNLSSGSYIRFSNSNGPSVSTGYITLTAPNGITTSTIPLDSSQSYTYAYDSAPSSSSFQRCYGYTFER